MCIPVSTMRPWWLKGPHLAVVTHCVCHHRALTGLAHACSRVDRGWLPTGHVRFWGEKKSSKNQSMSVKLSKRNAAAQETVVDVTNKCKNIGSVMLSFKKMKASHHSAMGNLGQTRVKFKCVVVMKMKAILHWTTPGTLGRALLFLRIISTIIITIGMWAAVIHNSHHAACLNKPKAEKNRSAQAHRSIAVSRSKPPAMHATGPSKPVLKAY